MMVINTEAIVSAISASFTELISELQADNHKLRQQMKVLAVEMGITTAWVLKTTGVELINKESEMYKLVHGADQESEKISEELTLVAVASMGVDGVDGAQEQAHAHPSQNVVSHGCDNAAGNQEVQDGESRRRSPAAGTSGTDNQNRVEMKNLVIRLRLRRLEDEPAHLQRSSEKSAQNKKLRGGHPVKPKQSWVCKICKKKSHSRAAMKAHERIHTGEKPFRCGVCKRAFRVRWNRDQHVKTHTNERLHACDYCDSRFYALGNKRIHEMTHTGERPFPCHLCERAFRGKREHEDHVRTHTRERPYKCNTCGLAFTQQATLQTHSMIHANRKPYVCAHCGARFRQVGNKRRHEMTHTGEKPFACSFCGKSFRAKQGLEMHVRTHTNERPYGCGKCKLTFSWSYGLRMHERRCHTKATS